MIPNVLFLDNSLSEYLISLEGGGGGCERIAVNTCFSANSLSHKCGVFNDHNFLFYHSSVLSFFLCYYLHKYFSCPSPRSLSHTVVRVIWPIIFFFKLHILNARICQAIEICNTKEHVTDKLWHTNQLLLLKSISVSFVFFFVFF